MNYMDCNLCGSSLVKRLFVCETDEVVRCNGCGLVRLALPHPGYEELDKVYSQDYFHERESYFFKDGIIDASGVLSAHVKDFQEGLNWIGTYKSPPGKLLDIGCATGTFLSIAKKEDWECYGVEISDYAASIAREKVGVDIFNGSLRKASFPDGFFDVVTMWDTIEHLSEPLEELSEVWRVLKPGGIFLINTPNEESFMRMVARFLYKVSSGFIRSPINSLYHCYHLYYFTTATMSLLFRKSGFNIIAQRKKVIPITRGRGSKFVKVIVRCLSLLERVLHAEYELFFIVQKDPLIRRQANDY